MSILARIRAHGGDVTRKEWRFALTRGRLSAEALTWLRAAGRWRAACAEAWDQFERWEERAAIREFCGGLSRPDAEREAYREVMGC